MPGNRIAISLRWSDVDANQHVRHGAYHDLTDSARLQFFDSAGLSINTLYENNIGPVIFREECVYHREIFFGDAVFVDVWLLKSTLDFRKWSILHEIYKNNKTLAATLVVEGAWIDTRLRKVVAPPASFLHIFNSMPQHANFEMIGKP